jgi:hypothetical protein
LGLCGDGVARLVQGPAEVQVRAGVTVWSASTAR